MQIMKQGLKNTAEAQVQMIKQSVVLNQLRYYFLKEGVEEGAVYWRLRAVSSKKAGLEPVGVFLNNGNSVVMELTLQGGGKSVTRKETLEAGDMLLAVPS